MSLTKRFFSTLLELEVYIDWAEENKETAKFYVGGVDVSESLTSSEKEDAFKQMEESYERSIRS
jgi:hypothetical protein